MVIKRKVLQRLFAGICSTQIKIELAFDQLIGIVEKVGIKFTRFLNIASTVMDAKDISNVICASDYFDKNQLLDCGLLAVVFCA